MDTLKDKDLDRYYQERFITTGTPGWEEWMEEVKTLRDAYANISSVRTPEELFFRKGQVDILDWILNVRELAKSTYDDILTEENDESV